MFELKILLFFQIATVISPFVYYRSFKPVWNSGPLIIITFLTAIIYHLYLCVLVDISELTNNDRFYNALIEFFGFFFLNHIIRGPYLGN